MRRRKRKIIVTFTRAFRALFARTTAARALGELG
jgi:hypothetical protein